MRAYLTELTWGVFPYICLTVLVVGTLCRYQTDQLRSTSKSSELLEKKLLIVGSVSFHIGLLFVIIGHILGLLIPLQAYSAIGVSSEVYHRAAIILGGLAGLVTLIGISILLYRRIAVASVRRDSDPSDYIVDGLLWIVILTGVAFTLGYNLANGPYEYRSTVGAWVRGVLTLQPNAALMTGVPLILQAHVVLTMLLFGISPFTRLVHVYSFPATYVIRAPLVYRARYGYGGYGRADERAGLAQPQPAAGQPAPPWVSPPPAAPAEEPSRPEPVDELEHLLVRVTEPVRWLWERPHHLIAGDQPPSSATDRDKWPEVASSDQHPHVRR